MMKDVRAIMVAQLIALVASSPSLVSEPMHRLQKLLDDADERIAVLLHQARHDRVTSTSESQHPDGNTPAQISLQLGERCSHRSQLRVSAACVRSSAWESMLMTETRINTLGSIFKAK